MFCFQRETEFFRSRLSSKKKLLYKIYFSKQLSLFNVSIVKLSISVNFIFFIHYLELVHLLNENSVSLLFLLLYFQIQTNFQRFSFFFYGQQIKMIYKFIISLCTDMITKIRIYFVLKFSIINRFIKFCDVFFRFFFLVLNCETKFVLLVHIFKNTIMKIIMIFYYQESN